MTGDLIDPLIGLAFVAGIPGYFVLQSWTLKRFRGGWRIAASIPLIGAVGTIGWSLFALSEDSNLWPLTFVLFASPAAFYLLVVAALRRFAAADAD